MKEHKWKSFLFLLNSAPLCHRNAHVPARNSGKSNEWKGNEEKRIQNDNAEWLANQSINENIYFSDCQHSFDNTAATFDIDFISLT